MTKRSDDVHMTLKSWTLLLTKYLTETQMRKRRKGHRKSTTKLVARIQIVHSTFLNAVT